MKSVESTPPAALESPVAANIEVAFLADDGALLLVGWVFDPGGLVTGLALGGPRDSVVHEWSIYGAVTIGDGGVRIACRRVMRPDVTQAMADVDRCGHDCHGIVCVIPRCQAAERLAVVLGDGRIATTLRLPSMPVEEVRRLVASFTAPLVAALHEAMSLAGPGAGSLLNVLPAGALLSTGPSPGPSTKPLTEPSTGPTTGPSTEVAVAPPGQHFGMPVQGFADLPSTIDVPDVLEAAIDQSFPLGEAGLLIAGRHRYPAGRPISVHACGEQGRVVEISGLEHPLPSEDVAGRQRGDAGADDPGGFICLVPLPTRADEPRALRFDCGDRGIHWLGIPTRPIDHERSRLLEDMLALLPPRPEPGRAEEVAARRGRLAWADLPPAAKFPLRVRFADSAETIYDTVAAALDPVAYAEAHPDAMHLDVDPVTHYLLAGADEGRNPTADFDTRHYLRTNEDVRAARINPFFHYLVDGRREGRSPLPPASGASSSARLPDDSNAADDAAAVRLRVDFESWKSAVAEVFSPDFYLRRYPDIATAGIDPWEHYFQTGWMEGRQPTWDFHPDDYLERYPDVARARLEPLYHFLTAGREEGRVRHDDLFDQFQHLKEAPVRRRLTVTPTDAAAMGAVTLTDPEKLRDAIATTVARRSPKGIVVGISHDNALEVVGGIQNCLNDEQRTLTAAGWMYVHLYPAVASLDIFSETHRDYPVGINVDGRPFGTTSGSGIDALFDAIPRSSLPPLTCVLHSLLGHSVEPVIRLAKRHRARTYLWVHDYGLVCSNFLLTRNELEYCAAPPVGSATCGICSFGASRKTRIRLIQQLIDQIPVTVVAPSRFAANLFAAKIRTRRGRLAGKIVRHTRFVDPPEAVAAEMPADGRPLRIAYLGHEAFHKGWVAWKRLLRNVDRSRGVEFLHLGTRQTVIDFVRHREVAVTADRRDAMVEAVREERVDYAFIWPNWPETYSYVACEAIAGGARILTNDHSGNIADMVRDGDRGVVYGALDELVAELNAGQPGLRKDLLERPRRYHHLRYNPGCAADIMAAGGGS